MLYVHSLVHNYSILLEVADQPEEKKTSGLLEPEEKEKEVYNKRLFNLRYNNYQEKIHKGVGYLLKTGWHGKSVIDI